MYQDFSTEAERRLTHDFQEGFRPRRDDVPAQNPQLQKTEKEQQAKGNPNEEALKILQNPAEFAPREPDLLRQHVGLQKTIEQAFATLAATADGLVILSEIVGGSRVMNASIRDRAVRRLYDASRENRDHTVVFNVPAVTPAQIETIVKNLDTYQLAFRQSEGGYLARTMISGLQIARPRVQERQSQEAAKKTKDDADKKAAFEKELAVQQTRKERVDAFRVTIGACENAVAKAQQAYEKNPTDANFQAILTGMDTMILRYETDMVLLRTVLVENEAKVFEQGIRKTVKTIHEQRMALVKAREDAQKLAKERRDTVETTFKRLSAAAESLDVVTAEAAVKELREMPARWASQDGTTPDPASPFMQRVEAAGKLVAWMRANENAHREVDAAYRETEAALKKQVETTFAIANKSVADHNAINGLPGLGAVGSAITTLVSGISGAEQGFNKTAEVDYQRYLKNVYALNRLYTDRSLIFGRNVPPTQRLKTLQGVYSGTLNVSFTEASAELRRAQENLSIVNDRVRAVSNFVPGGGLGVAAADFNPEDGASRRNLGAAIGLTALDVIPGSRGVVGVVQQVLKKTLGQAVEIVNQLTSEE